MTYGLLCSLQWEDYIIEVRLPKLWTDPNQAECEKLTFMLDDNGLSYVSTDGCIIGVLKSSEWWSYRIFGVSDDSRDKLITSLEDYLPVNCSLSDFLPYTKGDGEKLLPYSLDYLSFNIYF